MPIAALIERLRAELSEDLRCCAEYAGEEVYPHYLRPDVDPATARERAHLLRRFYIGQESVRRHETLPSAPGRGSVHYFEDLVALMIPLSAGVTVGVFVDGDPAAVPEPHLSQWSNGWPATATDEGR